MVSTLDGIKQVLGDLFLRVRDRSDRQSRPPNDPQDALGQTPTEQPIVKFWPAVKPVRVPRLTDSEIAVTSSAFDQGIWINVLEKAFGEVRLAQPQTKRADDEIDLDVISRGGKIRNTIQLMTGHKAFDISIRKVKNKKLAPPTGAEIPRISTRLDSVFSKAFASNRLVCAEIAPGVSGKDIPPGLVGSIALRYLRSYQTKRKSDGDRVESARQRLHAEDVSRRPGTRISGKGRSLSGSPRRFRAHLQSRHLRDELPAAPRA